MKSPAFGVVACIVLLSQMFSVKIVRDIWPRSIPLANPVTKPGDGIPYVFESLTSAILLAIWLCDPAFGVQVIKYFALGTSLFLAPVWVPTCFDLLHALVSHARLPPIYVEAIAFWDALFKQQIAPGAQAWFSLDDMSNSPIARLAEAILLPALVCVAAEALLFSMYRLLCLTVRTVRTTRSRAFRCIESALFWVVDMIFWRIPCKANLVFHQTCSYVKNLAIRGWRLVLRINDKAISLAFQKISRANRRLLQALWSPISATGSLATDLVRNIHEPGAVHVDPRLEARFFYTAFFFGCFVFSAYVHIVHLGYPLRSSIPLSAGWASVLLVYSAVAQYFSPPANLELDTAVLIMESEVPPRPANPALAQFRESSSSPKATPLLMSFEDPPIAKSASESPSPSPSRPPSPNPSSSGASSEGEEEEEEEELDTTDWAFVLRRSLTEDLHRALSPIMEVSSAASTVSLAFSESPASPIQSPSPKHTAAAAATTPPATPRHVPTTPVSLARVEAQRVSKARAQRDMTEFLSFSVALESKTPARVRAGGDGDGLQSNGADVKDAEVEVDVAAAAMVVEKAGAREEASAGAGGGAGRNAVNWRRRVGGGVVEFVPKFDQSKARPCRQNCEAFYCAGECGDRVGPV